MIKDVEAFASGLKGLADKASAGEIVVERWEQSAVDIGDEWLSDGLRRFEQPVRYVFSFEYQVVPKDPIATPIEHLIERLKKELP